MLAKFEEVSQICTNLLNTLYPTAVEIPRMTDLIRMPFSDFRYFWEKFEEKKKKSLKKQDFHFEVAQI